MLPCVTVTQTCKPTMVRKRTGGRICSSRFHGPWRTTELRMADQCQRPPLLNKPGHAQYTGTTMAAACRRTIPLRAVQFTQQHALRQYQLKPKQFFGFRLVTVTNIGVVTTRPLPVLQPSGRPPACRIVTRIQTVHSVVERRTWTIILPDLADDVQQISVGRLPVPPYHCIRCRLGSGQYPTGYHTTTQTVPASNYFQ